jgi:predicted DNA-binding transcriptional regulator AlpA
MASMLSVPVFLAEHGISRSLFYRLVQQGRGPRLTKIAGRTLISAEAAAEWRARMERETEQSARSLRAGGGPRPEAA